MGAYGSPDLYPYDRSNNVKPLKKCYFSKLSIFILISCICIFAFIYFFGGMNQLSLAGALVCTSLFSILLNIIAVVVIKVKKIRNSIYIIMFLLSALVGVISFIWFGFLSI